VQEQISELVTLVIAFLSILTIIGVSVAGILVSMVLSAKKETSELRREVAAYKAVADKLEGDAKHNVNQIWNRLDDESRVRSEKMMDFIVGMCSDVPKKAR